MRTDATPQAPLQVLPFDVVENPVTGERIVFTETGADSAGERLRFDFFVRPGGGVPVATATPASTSTCAACEAACTSPWMAATWCWVPATS